MNKCKVDRKKKQECVHNTRMPHSHNHFQWIVKWGKNSNLAFKLDERTNDQTDAQTRKHNAPLLS